MTDHLVIRRAQASLRTAETAHDALRERVLMGDASVTGEMLLEAEGKVTLARLQIEAARRQVAQEEAALIAARRARGEASRRRRRDAAESARREGWVRAIESGQAAGLIEQLVKNSSLRPTSFPDEYLEVAAERWQTAGFPEPFLQILRDRGLLAEQVAAS